MLFLEAHRRRVADAMRSVGAVSPASAQKASQLPDVVREHLDYWVTLGVVREGAPGTFYLFVAPEPPAWSARRVTTVVIFWLIVIIIPVFILWLSSQ